MGTYQNREAFYLVRLAGFEPIILIFNIYIYIDYIEERKAQN